MSPTLLVLAAGMGSRYGALKQMDGVGPNNEAILDYSIFDAKRAGFGKVVFVIREDFAEAFKKVNNTIGPIIMHGRHHVAQKSTKTNWPEEITESKFSAVK